MYTHMPVCVREEVKYTQKNLFTHKFQFLLVFMCLKEKMDINFHLRYYKEVFINDNKFNE